MSDLADFQAVVRCTRNDASGIRGAFPRIPAHTPGFTVKADAVGRRFEGTRVEAAMLGKTRGNGGSALIVAVILVIVTVGLAGSYLVVSGVEGRRMTEAVAQEEARDAAERGIDHMRVHLLSLVDPEAEDPVAAWDAVLATDDGTPAWAVDVPTGQGSYTVRVLDNDDGDGDPWADDDGLVVLQSIGTGVEGDSLVIEASVLVERHDPTEGFAILTGDDLLIYGNEVVDGTLGRVHANGDMALSGDASISRDASASGEARVIGESVTIGGSLIENRQPVTIKPVTPADYRPLAASVLTADGRVLDGATGVVVADLSSPPGGGRIDAEVITLVVSTFNGFTWNSRTGWTTTTGGWVNGTYYVEGGLTMNHGGTSTTPWAVTIVAEGDIVIQGNPYLRPYLNETELFVAGGDVCARGTGTNAEMEGLILAHEEVSLDGNITFAGRVVAEAALNTAHSPVDSMASMFGGSVIIEYDGDLTRSLTTSYRLPVKSWSEGLETSLELQTLGN